MAKNPINIYGINKAFKNVNLTREKIIEEKFPNIDKNEIDKAIQMDLTFSAKELSNFIDITNETTILGLKPINKQQKANLEVERNVMKRIAPALEYIHNIGSATVTGKSQTPDELISNTIKLDRTFNHSNSRVRATTSKTDILKSIDIFNNSDTFYAYDTETLPKVNGETFLQELSFRKFNKKNGRVIEDPTSRLETVVGINPYSDQFKEYQKMINEFDINGFGDNGEYKVIADRLAKMGHKDTELDWEAGYGLVTVKNFVNDESDKITKGTKKAVDTIVTKENMQKGLDLHAKVWEKQNKERLGNGLTVVDDYMMKIAQISQGNMMVSFNGKTYDNPIINQDMARRWMTFNDSQKKEYAKKLGLKNGVIPTISSDPVKSLDMRDVFRLGLQDDGKSSLYSTKQLTTLAGSLLQQESIGHAYFEKEFATAAHTAGVDVNVLANIAGAITEDGDTLLNRMGKKIESQVNVNTVIDNDTILMATQADFYNNFSKNGALSFTTDAKHGTLRSFNGYDIGDSVEYMGEYGKSRGIKKDVPYRVKSTGSFNTTEEWVKELQKVHPEYATGELHFVTLSPVLDKSLAEGNNILKEDITYILPSNDGLERMMSSDFVAIGKINKDGTPEAFTGKNGEVIKEMYSQISVNADGVIEKDFDISKVIEQGTQKAKNDSAARAIRNHEYKKAKQFVDYRNYVIENNIEPKIGLSLATAQKVAKGETLKIQNDIDAIFGYRDFNRNQTYLWNNTINNIYNSYDYQESLEHVYRQVIDTVESNYGKSDNAVKEMIGQMYLGNIMDEAEKRFGDTNVSLPMYKKDLNYFEFNMPEGYFKNLNPREINSSVDNVVRVNLSPEKEYDLVNKLLKRRTKDDRILNDKKTRNAYGQKELYTFMDTINKSEEYQGIFDNILYGTPVTEIKNKIKENKTARDSAVENLFSNLNNVIDSTKSTDKELITLRDKLKDKIANREIEVNKIDTVKFEGNNYNYQELVDLFSTKIYTKEEWIDLSSEEKDEVRQFHKEIIALQDYLSNSKKEKLDTLDNEIEQTYNALQRRVLDIESGTKKDTWQAYRTLNDEYRKLNNELHNSLKIDKNVIKEKENFTADTISEQIQLTLKDYRSKKPYSGLIKDRKYQDVTKPYAHAEKMTNDFIQEVISKTNKEIPNLNIIDAKLNDKALITEVEKMVDSIFMPSVKDKQGRTLNKIEDLVKFAQNTYGYNEEIADIFRTNLEVTRNDYVEGLTSFVKGISGDHGGLLSYNKKNKNIVLHMNNKDINITDLIPTTEYVNGVLQRKNGLTRTAANLKIDTSKAINGTGFTKSNVRISSELSTALEPLNFTKAALNRAEQRGESKTDAVLNTLGQVGKIIRGSAYKTDGTGSAVGKNTYKDTFGFQKIDFEKVYEAIPYILDELKTNTNWQESEMIARLEKHKKSLENGYINTEVKEAVAKDLKEIMKIMTGHNAGEEIQGNDNVSKVLRLFSANSKDTDYEHNKGWVGTYDPLAFIEFDNGARPNTHQFTNTRNYSAEELSKKVSSKALKDKNLEVGSRIVTARQFASARREIAGLGKTEIGVVGTMSAMSEKTYKSILSDQYSRMKNSGALDETAKKVFDNLRDLNLTEQAKIMDGHVYEMLMDNSEIQTVKTLKNLSRDLSTNNEVMKKRIEQAEYSLKLVDDGNIALKLGKPQLVKRNDPLLAMEGYAGTTNVIDVKQPYGLFGKGFAVKNTETIVSETELNKFLNANKDKIIDVAEDGTQKLNIKSAYKLLTENFDEVYHVDNLFNKKYNKMWIEGPEKSMAQALLGSLGEFDKGVKEVLEKTGFDDFIGRTARGASIDTLVDDILIPKINELKDDVRSNLKYSSSEELKEAIKNELYLPTNFVKENIGPLRDSVVFGIDNIPKHGNAGVATRQLIQDIAYIKQQEGMSIDEAYKFAEKEINNSNMFEGINTRIQDGHIITDREESASINLDAVKRLQEKYSLSSNYNFENGTSITINKKRALIGANNDESRISMSNPEIADIKSELFDIRKSLSSETDELKIGELQDRQKYLEHKLAGATKYDKTMKVGSRAKNNMSLFEYDDYYMNDIKNRLDDESFNKLFGHMYDKDGNNSYIGKRINEPVLQQLNQQFNEKSAENMPFIEKSADAMIFNSAKTTYHAKDARKVLEDSGFKETKLNDLLLPFGENSNFTIANESSVFNKNMIIKTSTGTEVAIPAIQPKILGDSTVSNDIMKSIMGLHGAELKLQNGMNGNLADGETIEGLRSGVENAADILKENIGEVSRATLKDMDNVELENAMYAKANMAMYLDGSDMNSSRFQKATFAGKTLEEHYKNGNYISASWAGTDHFKEYIDNYEKYGMNSKDEMMDWLEANGTMSLTSRSPDIREGSTVTAITYLDRNLHNQIVVSDAIAERANQDHDGDGRSLAELVHKESGTTYASWQMQGENVSPEVDKFFQEQRAAIAYEGMTINPKAHKNMKETVLKDKVLESKMANAHGILSEASLNGRTVTSTPLHEIDASVIIQNEKDFKMLEDQVINSIGEEAYSQLDHKEQLGKIQDFIDDVNDVDLQKTYKKTLNTTEEILKINERSMSKTGKGAVGYVNIPFKGLRDVAEEYGMSSKDRQLLSSAFYVMEEDNISRKNTISTGLALTSRITESANLLVKGGEKGRQGADQLIDMIQNINGESIVEYGKSHILNGEYEGLSDDELQKTMLEDIVSSVRKLSDIFNNESNAANTYKASTNRFNANTANDVIQGIAKSEKSRNIDFELEGLTNTTRRKVSRLAEEALEETAHGFTSGMGKGLAIGSLGLAASVMVAGYIGGNPTKPAETQAQEQFNNYESLQDEDLSIQSLPQGTGQGYVININAQSPKGQNHAMQAIQKAMNSSVPTDINISMNINDKQSNINSRFIDKLLAGAL